MRRGLSKDDKSGWFRSVFVPALAIVVVAAALGVGLSQYGYRLPLIGWFFEPPTRTITTPVVVEGIQDLNQLATVSMTQSVIVTKETGGGDLRRFLTGEKVILVAVGDVEAGVNLDELGRDDVRVDGERVTIRLPEPEILSVSLDEEQTRVYDRDQGILNLQPDDALVEEARLEAEQKIQAAAQENDILNYAESNAEDSIRSFVTALGFEKVEFVD
jgi:hypothetical protein